MLMAMLTVLLTLCRKTSADADTAQLMDDIKSQNNDLRIHTNTLMHSHGSARTSTIRNVYDTSVGYTVELRARKGELQFRREGNALVITYERDGKHESVKNEIRIDVLNNGLKDFFANEIEKDGEKYVIVNIVFKDPGEARLEISKSTEKDVHYEK